MSLLLLALVGCGGREGPPNVLLVSIDTVRYDHTSLGGARDTTPSLRALAEHGTTWPDAWAVGNESIYSHASILTGLYASEVALPDYASFSIPKDVPTLGTMLRAYGYATGAFTGGGHIIAPFGFDQGFDVYRTATKDTRAGSMFDSVPAAIAWIHEQKGPWFAFVHGYDAHSPYVQRGPFRHLYGTPDPRLDALAADPVAIEQVRGLRWFPDRRPRDFLHAAGPRLLGLEVYTTPAEPQPGERVETLTPADVTHLLDHYDSGIAYGDVWLGYLLAEVDLRDTLVIVLSDHGEDMLDHGFINHRPGLWDSTLHVPLVVAGPGFPAGVVNPGRVDHRSVVPTVMRAVGGTLPAGVTAGALQDSPDEPLVFAEGVMDQVSVRGDQDRLVLSGVRLASGSPDFQGAAGEVYREPSPTPTSTDDPALREALIRWRASLHPAAGTGAPIPEEIRRQLRERGYWEPEEGKPPGAEKGEEGGGGP